MCLDEICATFFTLLNDANIPDFLRLGARTTGFQWFLLCALNGPQWPDAGSRHGGHFSG